MLTKQISERVYIVGILLLIAFVFIIMIPALRVVQGNIYPVTLETYTHISFDSYAQISETGSLYDVFIFTLQNVFSLELLFIFIPLILGLFSILIFIGLTSRLDKKEQIYATILVFTTPLFILVHMGLVVSALLFLLILLFYYFYTKQIYFYYVSLFIIACIEPFVAVVFFVFLIIQSLVQKEYTRLFVHAFLGLVSLLTSFLLFSGLLFFSGFTPISYQDVFLVLTGNLGFSLFILVLGLYGMYISKRSQQITLQQIFLTSILVLSLFSLTFRLVSIALLSFYGAKSIRYFLEKKWSLHFLKTLTLILLFCIFLFTILTFVREQIQEKPNVPQVKAFQFINTLQTTYPQLQNSTILTDPMYASFVTYFTGMSVVELSDTEIYDLLLMQKYKDVEPILQQELISFIYVDAPMIQGTVWTRDNEGLLFIMENTDDFKRVYRSSYDLIYYNTQWTSDLQLEQLSR